MHAKISFRREAKNPYAMFSSGKLCSFPYSKVKNKRGRLVSEIFKIILIVKGGVDEKTTTTNEQTNKAFTTVYYKQNQKDLGFIINIKSDICCFERPPTISNTNILTSEKYQRNSAILLFPPDKKK